MSTEKLDIVKPITDQTTVPQGLVSLDDKVWPIKDGGEGIRATFKNLDTYEKTIQAITSSSSSATTVDIQSLTSPDAPSTTMTWEELTSKVSQYTYTPLNYKYPSGCASFNTLTSSSSVPPSVGLSLMHSLSANPSHPNIIPTSDKVFALLTLPPSSSPSYLPFLITLYNLTVTLTLKTLGRPRTSLNRLRYFDALGPVIKVNDNESIFLSFNQIENGLLRCNRVPPYHLSASLSSKLIKKYNLKEYICEKVDWRIHGALNCGANSCPPVEKYTVENVEEELERSFEAFKENNILREGEGVKASLIFKWYEVDFEEDFYGGKKVEWMEYDWGGGEEKEWKGGFWDTVKGIL
ncbi:hypothetical protein TrST_g5546 [Triparma strigata]|uniref:DUF547 domain-containing protein n=1 Tax=Triparma strigata TaxID=1606541 RepID=A0A9W7EUF8_9STRA|nr:hypothetical protein TrST_g5546 [Triparma strigata]